MKANISPSYDNKRQRLANIIPLNRPFTVYIEPTRVCNFKCFYCMHSTRDDKNGALMQTGYKIKHIEEKLYEKIIEQVVELSPKRIVLSGLGEPLCNPNLPEMIYKIRERGFQGRVDVITNAVLLNTDLVNKLILSGVSKFLISIQGLDALAYEKNCGVKIDYDKFLYNLKYLYKNRKSAKVFIKIIDELLSGDEPPSKFYQMFGPICDQIYIEHLVIMEKQMGDHQGKVDITKNLNNEEIELRQVCSVPFYHLNINSDGMCFPCPIPGLPKIFALGNLNEQSLVEIWNGKRRNNFLKVQLKKQRNLINECRECSCCGVVASDEENLDDVADKILQKMEQGSGGV